MQAGDPQLSSPGPRYSFLLVGELRGPWGASGRGAGRYPSATCALLLGLRGMPSALLGGLPPLGKGGRGAWPADVPPTLRRDRGRHAGGLLAGLPLLQRHHCLDLLLPQPVLPEPPALVLPGPAQQAPLPASGTWGVGRKSSRASLGFCRPDPALRPRRGGEPAGQEALALRCLPHQEGLLPCRTALWRAAPRPAPARSSGSESPPGKGGHLGRAGTSLPLFFGGGVSPGKLGTGRRAWPQPSLA